MSLQSLLLAATLAIPAETRAAIPATIPAPVRWDAFGHYTIARLTYDALAPRTRARVDSLVRAHPDFDSLAVRVSLDRPDAGRELFAMLSVWPDRIRGDARYYSETDTAARPTPTLPGFPDMARRAEWHYILRSFSTDGTPTIAIAEDNTIRRLATLARSLGDTARATSFRAYDLGWVVHVVSDLHQPLHATSRSSRANPRGDSGGNAERVRLDESRPDSTNLHSVWDGFLGRAYRGAPSDNAVHDIRKLRTASLQDHTTLTREADIEPSVERWTSESEAIARGFVYNIDERIPGTPPAALYPSYLTEGERIARLRIALAAQRLAALLELRLGY